MGVEISCCCSSSDDDTSILMSNKPPNEPGTDEKTDEEVMDTVPKEFSPAAVVVGADVMNIDQRKSTEGPEDAPSTETPADGLKVEGEHKDKVADSPAVSTAAASGAAEDVLEAATAELGTPATKKAETGSPPHANGGAAAALSPTSVASSASVMSAPAGPGPVGENEFVVTIQRQPEVSIGLNLDALEDRATFVDQVLPGAVKIWGDQHPNEPRLETYDRIVSINAIRGTTNSLLAEMRKSLIWHLVVQRPQEVTVSVDCVKHPTLGLDLKYSPNGLSLVISGVRDGAIQDWNLDQAKPDKICSGDRIVEVNGRRGTARQLLEAATNVEELDLVILHFKPAGKPK